MEQELFILSVFFIFSNEMTDADCPEGNPEGLRLLRESLKKVQVSPPEGLILLRESLKKVQVSSPGVLRLLRESLKKVQASDSSKRASKRFR